MRCLYCHSVIAAEPTLVSLFKRDEPLCLTCREKLTFKFPGERCGRCHQLVNKKTEVCSDCELLIGVYPHINKIYTVTDYNEETKMLMHRYKFVKDYALAEVLALLCSFSFKPYHAVVPILSIVAIEKIRTQKKALQKIEALLQSEFEQHDQKSLTVCIIHANAKEFGEQIKKEFEEKFQDITFVLQEFGPVVGTHVGEGAIGIGYTNYPVDITGL